ncbi:hypothetical protein QBC32DRAFT_332026 [Pseudoneurospora amorphoporcata]|uniref:Uncharacterized protein n=1 Tax=Pseudoneurospora amorphoporcata TaxID=241081 RepID=A0AAN6SJY3_9PEZI|nr:hypothetical protein QBC32DRAFT_332026 [Pseudoneurospora amorphoporcata]
MRFITILSLLTALAAASPVITPRNTNSAPAPIINKRVDIYWGWFARDAEQFKEDGTGEMPDAAEGVEGEQK